MAKPKKTIIKRVTKIENKGKNISTWKIAYADFVTAMMAFFLLMWLISVSSESTLQGVAEYFTPTKSISDKSGLGFDGGIESNIEEGAGAPDIAASSLIYGSPSKGHRVDSARLPTNMSEIEKEHFINIMNSIRQNREISNYADNLHIDITNEGLRIQVMDSDNRPVFEPNTSNLKPYMEKILKIIGKMIQNQPNYIAVSGHTASVKERFANTMDFWKLSSDRANKVRRFLTIEQNLLNKNQIVRIIGKADKEPFDTKDPYSNKNIRIGITLLNANSINAHLKSSPDKISN